MKTNKEVQKWFCLNNVGEIQYVGEFSSFDNADDAIGNTAIWLITEDSARQWLAALKSILEPTMTRKQVRATIPASTFKGVLYELNKAGIPWSLVSLENSTSSFELVADGTPTGFVIYLEGDNWSASTLIDLPVKG